MAGLRNGLGVGYLSSGALSAYAYPEYKLALDFNEQKYWKDGTEYGVSPDPDVENPVADITEYPGYSYTRTGIQGAVGYTYGPELLENGTFDRTTEPWLAVNTTNTVSSGRLKVVTNVATLVHSTFIEVTGLTIGTTYRLKGTVTLGNTANLGRFHMYFADSTTHSYNSNGPYMDYTFIAAAATLGIECEVGLTGSGTVPAVGDYAFFDNISLKEVLTPSVSFFAANVPAINSEGYHPYVLKTNLLLRSQEFNASWLSQAGATVTANTGVAPDGTVTADTITFSADTDSSLYQLIPAGAGTYTMSCFARSSVAGEKFRFIAYNGTDGQINSSDFTSTTEWQRFSHTFTTTVTSNYYIANASTGGIRSIFAWQAQLISGTFPDGGPIIKTEGTTAAVGASTFYVADAPEDANQLFWATIKTSGSNASSYQQLASWSNVTATSAIDLYTQTSGGGGTGVDIQVGGLAVFTSIETPRILTGEYTVLLLRNEGTWRAGKIVSGVLTWFGAATVAAFPPGMTRMSPGDYSPGPGVYNMCDPVLGVYRKLLTNTSDANIIATVGEG